jgi:putative membrane protein
MDSTKRTNWFQFNGSVVPAVRRRVILFVFFGFFISSVHNLKNLGFSLSLPILGSLIPTILIALLVVFKTNTAYERFREGRKSWGNLINAVHNLARHSWVVVRENDSNDRMLKVEVMRLLVAFPVAAKLYLREEPVNNELAEVLPTERYLELQKVTSPPLQIAFWIEDYIQEQYKRKCITGYQVSAMHKLLDRMVDSLGSCDRIVKTPIPLVYDIRLKEILLAYCLALPFQLVEYFHWFTGLVVGLISFVLLTVEEISSQLENPFGDDDNDLPLDSNCETSLQNIQELMSQEPGAGTLQLTSVNHNQEPQFWDR